MQLGLQCKRERRVDMDRPAAQDLQGEMDPGEAKELVAECRLVLVVRARRVAMALLVATDRLETVVMDHLEVVDGIRWVRQVGVARLVVHLLARQEMARQEMVHQTAVGMIGDL